MNASIKDAELHRRTITSYVYRLIGSLEDAKDITQETILKYISTNENAIENPKAWMFKVASNLSYDFLRKYKKQREAYIGPWLPEPYIEEETSEDKMYIDESLSMAFIVLMQRLNYKERMAYVLYEIFEFKHKEIAHILEITPENSRKLTSRANEKIKDLKSDSVCSLQEYKEITTQFIQAIKEVNIEALQNIFTKDISVYSDGGGNAVAARKPLYGDDVFISKFLVKVIGKYFIKDLDEVQVETLWFNGSLGIVLKEGEVLTTSLQFQIENHRIKNICIVRNPDKLKGLKTSPSKPPTS